MEGFVPTRHAVHVLPEEELQAKLRHGRPLRVKLGIDPTSPDVHLGFAVVLDRLREWQDAGHTVVLIVGDYTARIGDPSGRSAERPVLADEELDANAQHFAGQVFRVLDRERTEIRFNGDFSHYYTGQEMVYGDIEAKWTFMQPIFDRVRFIHARIGSPGCMQVDIGDGVQLDGWTIKPPDDSVAIEADVEIGGTDQLYNLLAGRDVMAHYGLEPQVVVTYPLLVGVDGAEKMSKSRGNYVGILEPPEEMFGKTMSIPDVALPQWWELLAAGGEHPDDPM